jgi:branched-chain amino acid transport system permease protein
VTAISFGIFGFLLLVMMVLRPEGLLPSARRKLELHEPDDPAIAGEHAQTGTADQLYEVRQG